MMQGDAYLIPFCLLLDGEELTSSDVSDVEIMIGTLRKTYANEQITYGSHAFNFPLTQAETFAFGATEQPCQIRVKLTGGNIVGVDNGYIDVVHSRSTTQL